MHLMSTKKKKKLVACKKTFIYILILKPVGISNSLEYKPNLRCFRKLYKKKIQLHKIYFVAYVLIFL